MFFGSKSQVWFVKLIKMKLIVAAIFVLLAVSAHAEDFEEWEEIDWSKVVPVEELPGFWDGREMKEIMEKMPITRGARIVGGQIVTPHAHPYQAGLLSAFGSRTGSCGGSLISSTRVLTAAHCIVGATSSQAILGAHILTTVESTQQRRTVQAANFRNHPQYNPNNLNNDISILILPSAVTINNQVRTIARASGGTATFAGQTGQMTGWGRTADVSGGSTALRSVTNPIITNDQCRQYYSSQWVIASTICTSTAGGRGTCQGKIKFDSVIKSIFQSFFFKFCRRFRRSIDG
jgi:hypothetical protein